MFDIEFERLIVEAEQQPFSGWDFSYIHDRWRGESPGWNYAELVRPKVQAAKALLDLGTGGGEFLSSLAPLPSPSVATEAYLPNVEVAGARLTPLGVEVRAVEGPPDNVTIKSGEGIGSLPFPDESFPLIIDRHTSYYPSELYRILERPGTFVTQQVGGEHNQDLNRLLGAPWDRGAKWDLAFAVRQLQESGFEVVDQREAFPETVFFDIGAVVYYLKAVPWQVLGFTVPDYRERLAELHHQIQVEGSLRIRGHFFYLEAAKG